MSPPPSYSYELRNKHKNCAYEKQHSQAHHRGKYGTSAQLNVSSALCVKRPVPTARLNSTQLPVELS